MKQQSSAPSVQPAQSPTPSPAAPDAQGLYGNSFVAEQAGLSAAEEGTTDWPILGSTAGTTSGEPGGTKAEALARHTASIQMVEGLLASALAQTPDPQEDDGSRLTLLHNSAEWIDAGRIGLQLHDRTHDSEQRSPDGKRAYFDTRVPWDSTSADYDGEDLQNNDGVRIDFPEGGHYDPSTHTIVITDAAMYGEADVTNTLIHEVQHAVDSGADRMFERGIGKRRTTQYDAPPWAYREYASEYRARTIDPIEAERFGDPTQPNTTAVVLNATRDPTDPDVVSGTLGLEAQAKAKLANQQQWSIFTDMVPLEAPQDRWYDWATQEWLALYGYYPHYYVLDPDFRAYVDALGSDGTIEGGNQLNSIRIDDLATAIHQGDTIEAIVSAANRLDTVDRAFLQDVNRSGPFWRAAERDLADRPLTLDLVRESVNGSISPDPNQDSERYTIVAGDTLPSIAARVFGDPQRWTDLVQFNPDVDPQHLVVGSTLLVQHQTPTSPDGVEVQHVATEGETMVDLALRYYGMVMLGGDLVTHNWPIAKSITDPLEAGTTVEVPRMRTQQTTVSSGDTLGEIALAWYGDRARSADLFRANSVVLTDPDLLPVGVTLVLPMFDAELLPLP